MSEKQKHTPGPWIYDELTDEIVGANDDRRILQDTFMCPADAQLAAAAPDLLEAATHARSLIEAGLALQVLGPTQLVLSPDGDYELEWDETLNKLKAAIKRAALTGGEEGEAE